MEHGSKLYVIACLLSVKLIYSSYDAGEKKQRTLDDVVRVSDPLGLLPCIVHNGIVPFLDWQDLMRVARVQKSTRYLVAHCVDFYLYGPPVTCGIVDVMQWFNRSNSRALKRVVIKNTGMLLEETRMEKQIKPMIERSTRTLTFIDIDCWWPTAHLLNIVGQCTALHTFSGLKQIQFMEDEIEAIVWREDLPLKVLEIDLNLHKQRSGCGIVKIVDKNAREAAYKSVINWLLFMISIYGNNLTGVKMPCEMRMLQCWLDLDITLPWTIVHMDIAVEDTNNELDVVHDEKIKTGFNIAVQLAHRCLDLKTLKISAPLNRLVHTVHCALNLPRLEYLEIDCPLGSGEQCILPRLKYLNVDMVDHMLRSDVILCFKTKQCDWHSENCPNPCPYCDVKTTYTKGDIFDAVRSGNYDQVDRCISLRANVNERDILGNTPLMVAAQLGHRDMVHNLCYEARMSGVINSERDYVNQLNKAGDFALCMAVRNQHRETCEVLLQRRANAYMTYKGHDMIWWAKRSVSSGSDLILDLLCRSVE